MTRQPMKPPGPFALDAGSSAASAASRSGCRSSRPSRRGGVGPDRGHPQAARHLLLLNGVNMDNWFPTTAYGALTPASFMGTGAGTPGVLRVQDLAAAGAAPGSARVRARPGRRRRPRARRGLQVHGRPAGRHHGTLRDGHLSRPGHRAGDQSGRPQRVQPDGRLPRQGRAGLLLLCGAGQQASPFQDPWKAFKDWVAGGTTTAARSSTERPCGGRACWIWSRANSMP